MRYGAIILSQIGIISKPNSYDARIAGDFNEPYLLTYWRNILVLGIKLSLFGVIFSPYWSALNFWRIEIEKSSSIATMHELPEISTSLTYLLTYWRNILVLGIRLSLFGVKFSPYWSAFKNQDWKIKFNSYDAQIAGNFNEPYLVASCMVNSLSLNLFLVLNCAHSNYPLLKMPWLRCD